MKNVVAHYSGSKIIFCLPSCRGNSGPAVDYGVGVSIIQRAIEKNEILSSSYFPQFKVFKMLRFEILILLVSLVQR